MIMSVAEFKTFVSTDIADAVLEAKLQALESMIRKKTNNNFQNRAFRFMGCVTGGQILCSADKLAVGDTIQVTDALFANGLYTISSISNGIIGVGKTLYDEPSLMITKVEYPMDVKLGVVNMLKWDIEQRSKVGIQSETISRHSVTYFNMDGDNSSLGYPKSLTGFLQPYMKARF